MTKPWDDLHQAVDLLEEDEVVGIPTETVYGLAASIDSKSGLEKIFRIKNRPSFDPLIVHVASRDDARSLSTQWPKAADALAKSFWPGPLTLVLPKSLRISDRISAGLPSVGIRVPAHPYARWIAREAGAYAAPSANLFGKTSPTTAQHVRDEFSEAGLFVVDGGPCQIGIESTVVAIENDQIFILRPGMISLKQIEDSLSESGLNLSISHKDSMASPGNLKEHYQPKVKLCLVYADKKMESPIILKNLELPSELRTDILDLGDNPFIAARELYSKMRRFSPDQTDLLLCYWSSDQGNEMWHGIHDRLKRASTFQLTISS